MIYPVKRNPISFKIEKKLNSFQLTEWIAWRSRGRGLVPTPICDGAQEQIFFARGLVPTTLSFQLHLLTEWIAWLSRGRGIVPTPICTKWIPFAQNRSLRLYHYWLTSSVDSRTMRWWLWFVLRPPVGRFGLSGFVIDVCSGSVSVRVRVRVCGSWPFFKKQTALHPQWCIQ